MWKHDFGLAQLAWTCLNKQPINEFVSHINTHKTRVNINLSLTEHKGITGENWPKVMGARSVQKRPRANIPQWALS